MSYSVVKKALDLFRDDLDDSKRIKSTNESAKEVAKSVTDKRIQVKDRSRLKRKHMKTNHNKSTKSNAFLDAEKFTEYDNTDDNLYLFAKIAHLDDTKEQTVNKVLSHQKGKLSKEKPKEEMATKESQSVFSDRDFDQFEKEYDFNFWDDKT